MNFTIEKSLDILERTPVLLFEMLNNISNDWIYKNEGGESWSVFDVVGHLIEGEKTDWIPRMKIILSDKIDKTFEPFNRFSQLEEIQQKTLEQLLTDFAALRKKNVKYLISKQLSTKELAKKGIHPAFGEVTLFQLLSTWAVHDLNHIAQISRIMAYQYKSDVGPWTAYLRILQ